MRSRAFSKHGVGENGDILYMIPTVFDNFLDKYETWSLKLSLSSKYMPKNLTDLTCLIIIFPSLIEMLLRSTREWVNNINEILSTFRDNLFAFNHSFTFRNSFSTSTQSLQVASTHAYSSVICKMKKCKFIRNSDHLCISLIYIYIYIYMKSVWWCSGLVMIWRL